MISGEGLLHSMSESTADLLALCSTVIHQKYLIVTEKMPSNVKMLLSLLPTASKTCRSVKLISDLPPPVSLATTNLKSATE
jgi:hypothetical protein